jgi:hypothetical protein
MIPVPSVKGGGSITRLAENRYRVIVHVGDEPREIGIFRSMNEAAQAFRAARASLSSQQAEQANN